MTGRFFCSFIDILDGIHDNIDPQHMGKSPKELGVVIKDNSWQELDKIDKNHPIYTHAEKLKQSFTTNFINKVKALLF